MSLRDAIDNLYEKLVAEAIDETSEPNDTDDYLTDVMCVALNRLPSKYYRHSVDMVFYLAEGEMDAMKANSLAAVKEARVFVLSHKRDV
ncbi:late competence development ComFB family protein [Marinobacter sp. CHS3-4]|uniref:late competence development ComFB family protein n=1 Tax=Marinobacter sp. CHS3-4 TaxID=3045174 RepID=UPI0024B58C45|nr:late competence development ComFB family protein [Marinobacter sp. CHS3-4]MDI9245169.1 late competence development ComFB family protein [Marinobacter sp. CHS3-4]